MVEANDHFRRRPVVRIGPELNAVLGRMKNWKAPGLDGIPGEFYKTAVENPSLPEFNMNQPGSKLGKVLLFAGNYLLAHGVPRKWNSCGLVVIPKAKTDPTFMTNYRGIALINVVVKLTSAVIERRIHGGLVDLKNVSS